MDELHLFRVELLLHNFFTDHKHKAYVMVNREWNSVLQFHEHIKKLFHLKTEFYLATEGEIYLPERENIGVVKEGEVITVVATPSKTSRSNSSISLIIAPVDDYDEGLNNSTTNHNISNDAPLSAGPVFKAEERSFEVIATEELNDCCRRKRTRKRKKKMNRSNNEANESKDSTVARNSASENNENVSVFDNFLKNSFVKAKPSELKRNVHVRFDDNEESASSCDEPYPYPAKARIIRAIIDDSHQPAPTTNGNGKSNIIVAETFREEIATELGNPMSAEPTDTAHAPPPPSSISVAIDTNLETPKSPPISHVSVANTNDTTAPSALEQLSKNIETMEKLESIRANSLLKTADIIAYKVFTPSFEKSGYIIAMIEDIHIPEGQTLETVGLNYDLTVEILAGKEHIQHLLCDDDNDGTIQITINRLDLMDAKFVSFTTTNTN